MKNLILRLFTKPKFEIPALPQEQIELLAQRIKPLVLFPKLGNKKYFIRPVDLWTTSFIWDPQPAQKAHGLEPLIAIQTLHTYGYHGLFKPTIAEVLAQIPKEYINQATAFEIINQPENILDLQATNEALEAGFHIAIVQLYR